MSQFLIGDVEITFPFEPYEEQIVYMKKVIECISERKVGVLESPTGTGKTLSLLCATLSWLNKNRHDPAVCLDGNTANSTQNLDQELEMGFINQKYLFPRIIYASRTHSQLSKAMSELQKTSFRNFNVTILGSRDQMCIHPQVMKEPNLTLKNALCSMHMKAKSCHFGNNVEKAKKDDTLFSEGITDIEDLIMKSRKISCCPYYLARELQARADIIFMPYNYLFDYQIRKALKISLLNAIVILDEAHNIDKVCEEASSVTIKSSDVALAITDITKEMQAIYDDTQNGYFMVEREYSTDELCFIKEKLTALEAVIDEFEVSKDCSITKTGVYIFEILKKAGIDCNVAPELGRLMSLVYEFISNVTDGNNRAGGSLKKLADDLDIIFSTVQTTNVLLADKDFRVHIEEENFKNVMTGAKTLFKRNNKPGKVINYWCFNPGYCLGNTVKEEVRSVILTSGTLAPLNSFSKEMSLRNPVTVECSHIVGNEQVLVVKLETGPRNVSLKCTYSNRQNLDYWREFGLTLQNFFRIIPDGVLIFFPGYATLNVAVKMWRDNGLWDKLISLKPIFIEPQNKTELQQICADYYKTIDLGNGQGAVLLGVCRGKISEGLDFSDKYGRAVIVAGLPYPPLFDPKVKLKKQYVDNNRKLPDDMTGETWYLLEATKAVNQAIGRVIRHNKDYGAIILCDAQFNNKNIVNNLSKWVQEKIVKAKNFGDSVCLLRSFFRRNNSSMPSPQKLTQSSQSFMPQPSFSQVNSFQKRSDMKVLETYLMGLSSNVNKGNINRPSSSSGPSTSLSESGFSVSNFLGYKSFKRQIKVVSNLIEHFERVCNLSHPSDSSETRSCLESIYAEENIPSHSTDVSFSLFNRDSLKNENIIGVLHQLLEEFERRNKSLPPPPSSVFALAEEPGTSTGLDDPMEVKLDKITELKAVDLISRLHKLNKHLESNKSMEATSSKDCNIVIPLTDGVRPAKRRKIKLESIKIDDIQLPGTDERSRARERRLNDTKNFLLELKTLLEPNSYYSLINLIKKLNSNDDFQETIKYLRALFPEEDIELKAIFKRCYLLFTGLWEKEFFQFCEINNL